MPHKAPLPSAARTSNRQRRVAIVVSRFHENVTAKLLAGAREALRRGGIADSHVEVTWVPGAFELPVVAEAAATSERFDAIVALGCVIRGAEAVQAALETADALEKLDAAPRD